MKQPKIYRFSTYGWETTVYDLFYNETEEDYSEKEFQLLCAKIICEEIDNKFINNLEFYKQCYKEEDIDKNSVKNEITVNQIYSKVVVKLEKYGFKRIISDYTFDIDGDEKILAERTEHDSEMSDNHKLVRDYYKIHLRNKKIQKIIE